MTVMILRCDSIDNEIWLLIKRYDGNDIKMWQYWWDMTIDNEMWVDEVWLLIMCDSVDNVTNNNEIWW